MTLPIPFSMPNLQIKAITPWDGRHRTLWSGIIPLEDKWLLFYREANDHGYDGASSIRIQKTQNKGMHFDPPVTIYDESGIDARNASARVMGGGRLGIMASRLSSNGYDKAPVFIYSDDDGATWTSKILTNNSQIVGWTGGTLQVHKYPASVGGHDENGYILFSSVTTNPGSPVVHLKTVDNGATWTSGVIYTPVGESLATQAVVRLGDTDRWLWLARREDGNEPTYAFKSTDMINWSGPYNTGQVLNDNPHNAMYWNGLIYWLACSRVTAGGGSPRPLGPIQDGLVHQWADAEDLWAADFEAGWPGWSECASFFGCEGHTAFFTDKNGDTYAVFGFNRRTSDNSTSIGIMGATSFIADFSAANNVVRPLTAADRGGIINSYSANQQTIGSGNYATIFNLSGKTGIELLQAVIVGSAVGYRLTIDGETVLTATAVMTGDDANGEGHSIRTLPPAKAYSSMKLEAFNASTSTRDIGWHATTREW